jgi:hypothetical protein
VQIADLGRMEQPPMVRADINCEAIRPLPELLRELRSPHPLGIPMQPSSEYQLTVRH